MSANAPGGFQGDLTVDLHIFGRETVTAHMFEAAEVAAEFLEQQPQFAEMGGTGHDASLPQRRANVDTSVSRRV